MKKFIYSLLILGAIAGSPHADEQTDSLAFEQKRRQILDNSPDERATLILGAAIDLGRDGYYAEALDLIYGLEDSAATAQLTEDFLSDTLALESAGSAPPISQGIPFTGYVQATGDFEDWEFQDEPWGGRIKAKLEWLPTQSVINRVTSVFQASDRNAYFDFMQKATSPGRMFRVELEEQVEKKIGRTYGDSLDRVYLNIWSEANTRPLGKPLSLAIPFRATLEQYRFDRFGSLSSRTLQAQPKLEAVSDDLRKSLILSWEIRQLVYPTSPATNNFSHGPVAWGEWYGDRVNVDAETRYQTNRYARNTSLYRQRYLETRAGLFIRTWPGLKIGFRAEGESEAGDYRDSVILTSLSTVQAVYRLQGSRWMVQPQLVWSWAAAYTATLSLAYERGDYPPVSRVAQGDLDVYRYLNAPYKDWKPALGLTVLAKTIFLNLTVEYETNTVPLSTYYSTGSSRGLGVNGSAFWKIAPWMEIDLTCIAKRNLDHGGLPGQIQDLTSISLGLTSRFP